MKEVNYIDRERFVYISLMFFTIVYFLNISIIINTIYRVYNLSYIFLERLSKISYL